jgi:hypothetical protein
MGVAGRVGGVVLVTNEPRKGGEGVGATEAGAPEWLNHVFAELPWGLDRTPGRRRFEPGELHQEPPLERRFFQCDERVETSRRSGQQMYAEGRPMRFHMRVGLDA